MGDLSPIAFDIETSGLDEGDVITVAGLATDVGGWLALNTTGREVDGDELTAAIERESSTPIQLAIFRNEGDLLKGLREFATGTIDGDRHYITAYNGERWRSGFDLPFLRRACVDQSVPWPFPDVAYSDTMDMVQKFDTGDTDDLVGVYDILIGKESCDPFDDSASAVAAHANGDWTNLLLHNLADITRTRELAVLAGRYVPRSDFKMKNLTPPDL